jgi:hypothetical protein
MSVPGEMAGLFSSRRIIRPVSPDPMVQVEYLLKEEAFSLHLSTDPVIRHWFRLITTHTSTSDLCDVYSFYTQHSNRMDVRRFNELLETWVIQMPQWQLQWIEQIML